MIICCLGNPGTEYARTRHNVGFMVADLLAQKHRTTWSASRKRYAEATIRFAGKTITVIKPLTYMNASGTAAKEALLVKGCTPRDMLVVVDEYNFPVGTIRLRPNGSDGGHNGIASIIQEVGTEQFWRLRLGIGRDFGPGELVDYVLSPFPPSQTEIVHQMLINAVDAIERIVLLGPEKAQHEINKKQ